MNCKEIVYVSASAMSTTIDLIENMLKFMKKVKLQHPQDKYNFHNYKQKHQSCDFKKSITTIWWKERFQIPQNDHQGICDVNTKIRCLPNDHPQRGFEG